MRRLPCWTTAAPAIAANTPARRKAERAIPFDPERQDPRAARGRGRLSRSRQSRITRRPSSGHLGHGGKKANDERMGPVRGRTLALSGTRGGAGPSAPLFEPPMAVFGLAADTVAKAWIVVEGAGRSNELTTRSRRARLVRAFFPEGYSIARPRASRSRRVRSEPQQRHLVIIAS